MVGNHTKFMVKLFEKEGLTFNSDQSFKSSFSTFSKEIRNLERKWFQFWKPKMIPNPDYIGGKEIEINIVRKLK